MHDRCQENGRLSHKRHSLSPGAGCDMETVSCCLRDAVFLLPPTPRPKTDQRHKPRPEQNDRGRQRNCRERGQCTGDDRASPTSEEHAKGLCVKEAETWWSRRHCIAAECARVASKEPRPSRRGFCKPRGNFPPLRYGLPFLPALPSGASWQIFVRLNPKARGFLLFTATPEKGAAIRYPAPPRKSFATIMELGVIAPGVLLYVPN